MKNKVFVNYSEWHIGGGEICAGQENDSWPSYEDNIRGFSVDSITLENVTPYHKELAVVLPEKLPVGLWVVVARYYDGGTFGSTSGYGSIEGVFETDVEAQEMEQKIRIGKAPGEGYKPWAGYFSGLEDVEVHLVALVKNV